MRCPHCGNLEDKVIESRMLANGLSIRRRRECIECSYRFTSYEKIEEKPLLVIKSNGRREPFERQKLSKGIERALEKRPVSQTKIEEILNTIEDAAALYDSTSREIPSSKLGDIVLESLYELDKVAYIRFASVYKNFTDLKAFLAEIDHLSKEPQ